MTRAEFFFSAIAIICAGASCFAVWRLATEERRARFEFLLRDGAPVLRIDRDTGATCGLEPGGDAWKWVTVTEPGARSMMWKLDAEAASKVVGRGSVSGEHFEGWIYNGTPFRLLEATIDVAVLEAPGAEVRWTRTFVTPVDIAPFACGTVSFPVRGAENAAASSGTIMELHGRHMRTTSWPTLSSAGEASVPPLQATPESR